MEIVVVCTYKIFLRINRWKNFESRSTFAKVIIKHEGAYVFGTVYLEGRWTINVVVGGRFSRPHIREFRNF